MRPESVWNNQFRLSVESWKKGNFFIRWTVRLKLNVGLKYEWFWNPFFQKVCCLKVWMTQIKKITNNLTNVLYMLKLSTYKQWSEIFGSKSKQKRKYFISEFLVPIGIFKKVKTPPLRRKFFLLLVDIL